MISAPSAAILALDAINWGAPAEWEEFLAYALSVAAGVCIGYALRGLFGRWHAETIERKMRMREEEAEQEIRTKLKEADVAARSVVLQAREEFEKTAGARSAELQAAEERLNARAENLDARSGALDAREKEVSAAAAAAAAAGERAKSLAEDAEAKLGKLAGLTHDEARAEVMSRAEASLREDAAVLSRRIQEDARRSAETAARKIIAEAIAHCAVSLPSSASATSVMLPDEEMKGRIVGRDGRNIRTFENVAGVTVILDDSPRTVVVSCFDPVRREIAVRALEALVADGRIHPARIEQAVAEARESSAKMHTEEGASAAAEARVSGLPDDILAALGRLRFRYSLGQNVLQHSLEVSVLCGKMAAELGMDAAKARRIGLLHDIGKALEGQTLPHAAAGAEFLRAQGEAEDVAAAVAAHHPESNVDGGPYGALCMAADAVSASRPGARRETGIYAERLEKLEALAMSRPGVEKALAVQSGRDVRVMVDPEKISDAEAQLLAQSLCREITSTMKFPGRIKVTVLRETRCCEYAG